MMKLKTFGLVLAFAMLCACTADKACTLIGCNDGLSIRFKGTAPENFSLRLKAASQVDLNLSCPGGSVKYTCLPGSVFVNDYTPAEIEVTYTAGDKTLTKNYKPTYTTSEPNGAGCGPSCRQANIELEI